MGGATSTYTYDGDGKRVGSTVGGTTTRFVYDVNAGLPVLLDDGSRKYVFGLGLAYAVPSSSGVEVYHTDGLGSVRAITNAAGTVVQTYQTDEFGIPTQTSGSSGQPFGYTGEQQDSTGRVYLRARMYDPQTGRFLQRDPLGGRRAAPVTLHRYSYAINNPQTFVDPTGLWCVGLDYNANFEVGLGFIGAAGAVTLGAAVCWGGQKGLNGGVYTQAGGYIGTIFGPEEVSFPPGSGNVAGFAFGGYGPGIMIAGEEVTSLRHLEGPSTIANIDIGAGPIQAGIEYEWAVSPFDRMFGGNKSRVVDSVVLSPPWPPFPFSAGAGVGTSVHKNYTWVPLYFGNPPT